MALAGSVGASRKGDPRLQPNPGFWHLTYRVYPQTVYFLGSNSNPII